jgi:hypothetical protein
MKEECFSELKNMLQKYQTYVRTTQIIIQSKENMVQGADTPNTGGNRSGRVATPETGIQRTKKYRLGSNSEGTIIKKMGELYKYDASTTDRAPKHATGEQSGKNTNLLHLETQINNKFKGDLWNVIVEIANT